ncbi:MAG: YicC family protein [Eubacteriaceae bacterium]|nr:YicC family protein [Eubacteriaceae bacterium]
MKSMTGYGSSEIQAENYKFSIEAKSINHRYKDVSIKLPAELAVLEEKIRKLIQNGFSRGKFDILVRLDKFEANKSVSFNMEAASEYVRLSGQIAAAYPGVANDLSVSALFMIPDVMAKPEVFAGPEQAWEVLEGAVVEAIGKLEASRAQEGMGIKAVLKHNMSRIRNMLLKLEQITANLPADHMAKLKERLEEAIAGITEDTRLVSEMLIYADKISVAEELARLKLHLDYFEMELESTEPIGRKLDFLIQEINREANTVASKSNSFDASVYVAEIKSELEKAREQSQNVE